MKTPIISNASATDIEGLMDDAVGKALLNRATDPILKPSVVGAPSTVLDQPQCAGIVRVS